MNVLIRRGLLLANLAVLLAGLPVSAADGPLKVPEDGTQGFRRILSKQEMQPLKTFDELTEPKRSLVIVLGDPRRLNEIRGGWRRFVQDGGALLVATDQRFDRFVSGQPVRLITRSPDLKTLLLPRLKPLALTETSFFQVPRADSRKFLDDVLALKPSTINPASFWGEERLTPLATVVDFFQNQQFIGGFAERDNGRLLVIADPNIFHNQLVLQLRPDNKTDNLSFAENCVTWLADGDVSRDRVLFLDNGTIQTDFDAPIGLPEFIMPPLETLVPIVNQILNEWQHEWNDWLVPHEYAHQRWLTVLTALLALGLFIYGFRWLRQAVHRRERELPVLQFAVAIMPGDQKLTQQRHRAMLANGNLWESARALVRLELPMLASARPPRVDVPGGWWQRLTTQWRIERIWRLGWGTTVEPVSSKQLARLPTEVHIIKKALTQRTMRLEWSL
jgi:hypothetical protein